MLIARTTFSVSPGSSATARIIFGSDQSCVLRGPAEVPFLPLIIERSTTVATESAAER